MKLSRYFSDLRKAYEAELDDLTSDSEGKDVLKKRLAAKRSEIGFLVQMLAYSPEMVAVVFHRAFRFAKPAALQRLVDKIDPQAGRYRMLFESSPLPMWVFDRETLRFLAVNDAMVRHYRYDRATLLSMSLLDIRPPEDVETVRLAKDGRPVEVSVRRLSPYPSSSSRRFSKMRRAPAGLACGAASIATNSAYAV